MVAPWNRITWDLPDWLDYAREIDRRRLGAPRTRAIIRHIQHFPHHLVSTELDEEILMGLRTLLQDSHTMDFGRALRGHRADHWTTPVWMNINNQLARLARIRGRNHRPLDGDQVATTPGIARKPP